VEKWKSDAVEKLDIEEAEFSVADENFTTYFSTFPLLHFST